MGKVSGKGCGVCVRVTVLNSIIQLVNIRQGSRQAMNKVAPMDYQTSAISLINLPHAVTSPNSHHNPPDTNRTCKICLEEEVTSLDTQHLLRGEQLEGLQLMVPCECSGSVGWVHQKCIRTWICKQIEGSGKKQAFCEICKSQIYFKLRKIKYCEFACKHLSLITGCNILSAIIELFLLIVMVMIFRYSLGLTDSTLLRYVLIVLICIVGMALTFTFILMANQAFIKTKREVGHIFSIQEAQQIGLREVRIKTAGQLSKNTLNMRKKTFNMHKKTIDQPQRHLLRLNGNGNRVANTHQIIDPNSSHSIQRRTTSNFPLIEFTASQPSNNH